MFSLKQQSCTHKHSTRFLTVVWRCPQLTDTTYLIISSCYWPTITANFDLVLVLSGRNSPSVKRVSRQYRCPLLASYHSCTVITNFLFIDRRLLLRPWDRYLYCWCSRHHWELKCTAHLTASNVIVLPMNTSEFSVFSSITNAPRTCVFVLFY